CSRPPCGPSRPRCPTPPPAPWTTSRPWWSSRRNRDPVHRKRRRRRCRCARPAPERSADHVDPSTVSLIRHRRRGKIPADREAARAYAGQPRRCCRLLLPERTVTMPYSSAPSPFSPAAAPELVSPPSGAAKPRLTFLGTGYLGATYAICFAELGYEVLGVDVDADKIAKLSAGEPPFHEPGLDELLRANLAAGRLRFTTSYQEAADFGDVHFICVGTPQRDDGLSADLSYVEQAVTALAVALP